MGYFAPPPEVGYDEERQERIAPAPVQPQAVLHHTPIRGSSVKPSPSSPADLSAIAGRGSTARTTPARPMTHYIPEREPRPADHSLRPTLTSLSTSPGQYMNDLDYSPISPADSGVRPFSFAVRAGATGHGMGESEQNGRRSFFGRWGGSVTSFFGGSQGGSGSMMDMQYINPLLQMCQTDNQYRPRQREAEPHLVVQCALSAPCGVARQSHPTLVLLA